MTRRISVIVLIPVVLIAVMAIAPSSVPAETCYTEVNAGPCCEPENSDLVLCNGGFGPPCFQYTVECDDKYFVIVSQIGKKVNFETEDCIESRISRACVGDITPPLQECEVTLAIGFIHGSARESGNPCTQVHQ